MKLKKYDQNISPASINFSCNFFSLLHKRMEPTNDGFKKNELIQKLKKKTVIKLIRTKETLLLELLIFMA